MPKNYVNDVLANWASTKKKVFKSSELTKLHQELKQQGKISYSLTISSFIKKLVKETDLHIENLSFPNRTEKRYLLNNYSIYDLAISLRSGAFLSHKSAAFLHGFVETEPNDIYLNYEQSPKPIPKGELTQMGINLAFKNNVRTSKNKASLGKYTIYILSGKYTNQLGTINITGPLGEELRTTNVERTLIDIAVRPNYAGGVENVLQIYKQAAKTVSIDKLAKILVQLKYIYPYHQAIGFYLDRTGVFSDKEIDVLLKIDMKFDFYLAHHMQQKKYSPKWRLFYPAELEK